MRKLILILLISFIICQNNGEFTEILQEDEVYVLDEKNFNDALNAFDYIFVEFYAPWCTHCMQFASEYTRIAKTIHQQGKAIVAKVDGSQNGSLMGKYQIKSFPNFRLFRQRKQKIYDGKRNYDDMVEYIENNAVPLIIKFDHEKQIKDYVQQNKIVFAYNGDDQMKLFKSLSNSFEGVQFATIENDELPTFLLYTPEGMFELLEEEFINEKNLKEYLLKYSYPTIFTWQKREQDLIEKENNASVFLFVNNEDLDMIYYRTAFELKEEIYFTLINVSEKRGENIFHNHKFDRLFGVKQFPQLFIYDIKMREKYKLEKQINLENIKKMVADWKQDKLLPFYKSEPIPATNDDPLKIIVGRNYQKEVIQSKTDFLLLFYDPNNSFCLKVLTIFDELAEFVQRTRVQTIVGVINYEENEVPGMIIAQYPTVKLYRKSGKLKLFDFKGDWNKENLIKFLQENTIKTEL